MRNYLIIVSLVCSFSFVLQTHAGEKRDAQRSTAKVEALIEKLDYGSKLDKLSDDERDAIVATPRNEEVIKTWIELRDLGLQAFPKAIEHLGDKRTSFTQDSGSTNETWTIGRACRDVLWCNLEPYNWAEYSSSVPPERIWWRPAYCREFLDTSEKAKAWLAAHRKKSLVDLQIEVLEWITTHRSKRKVDISTEDRKKLLDQLDKLKRTHKPLEPAVPWSK